MYLVVDEFLLKILLKKCVLVIVYEIVCDEIGLLLLKFMSEVVGRLFVLEGVRCLYKNNGGNGLLIFGVIGVNFVKVIIIGVGVVGIVVF